MNLQIEAMVSLQKKLNDTTNGKNWELGYNIFQKEINWLRCIYMEIAELIDSTPWKHWKNIDAQPDKQNIEIELVDIWHFIMSYALQETNIAKTTAYTIQYGQYKTASFETKLLIEESEKLAFIALDVSQNKSFYSQNLEKLFAQFFRCCAAANLSFTWLYKLYIGKNCLNQFRQDHGYKDGSYKKIWGTQEDNICMLEILKQTKDIDFEKLYELLEKSYQKI